MSETHLLRRYPENPILIAADFPRHVNSAFNAAAVKFNGQYLLLSWLEIYHGVRSTAAGLLYRLGAVLLDLEQPWRVVGRASEAILSPIAPEDFCGNVGNVVFTCGAILEDDGELKVYYGAADQVMCLATAPADDVIALCLQGAGRGA